MRPELSSTHPAEPNIEQEKPTVPGPNCLQEHIVTHAKVLLGWAVANLLLGGGGMFLSAGQFHHFLHMNAAWGSINLVVAIILWYKNAHHRPMAAATERYAHFKRLLLVNVGLDLGYLVVAYWFLQKAALSEAFGDYFRGFGHSIFLQGTVLLACDLVSLSILFSRRGRFMGKHL
ncbi:hypothetical protein GCM10027275_14910 [Rhabdobacter roseus]|nr:hypothetical protein [Rhabdobacter roseus]